MYKILTLTTALGFLAAPAFAGGHGDGSFQDRLDRGYVTLGAGINMVDDTSFNFAAGTDVDSEYDDGFAATLEAGYNFGELYFIDNVKLGFEFGYADHDIEDHRIGGASQAGSDGELSVMSFMANMYHEYDTGTKFVPYYGVGVGLAYLDAQDYRTTAVADALDDSDTAFMYQGTIGVNYIVNSDLDLGLRYRYSATEGAELTGSGTDAAAEDFDYEAQSLMFTVSYSL